MIDQYVALGKLPDGRWGVENLRETSSITWEDLPEIYMAFQLWWGLLYERRRPK